MLPHSWAPAYRSLPALAPPAFKALILQHPGTIAGKSFHCTSLFIWLMDERLGVRQNPGGSKDRERGHCSAIKVANFQYARLLLTLVTWDRGLAAYKKDLVCFCLLPAGQMDWFNPFMDGSGLRTQQLWVHQQTEQNKNQPLETDWIFGFSSPPCFFSVCLLHVCPPHPHPFTPPNKTRF